METLDYAKNFSRRQRAPALLAGLALVVGLAGNGYAVWAAFSLRHVPTGATIRPMNVSAAIMFAALATFALGLPCAIIAICQAWRRPAILLAALLGAAVCLTPGYSGQFVWNLIVAQRSLIIAE